MCSVRGMARFRDAKSQRFLDILQEMAHICVVAETDLRQQLARQRVHTQVWNIQEASDSDLKRLRKRGLFAAQGAGFSPLPVQTLCTMTRNRTGLTFLA